MTVYLLDNSVIQRVDRSQSVRDAMLALLEGGNLLGASDPTRLEAGYSATGPETHARMMRGFDEDLLRLPLTDEVGETASDLQAAMFEAGMGRAAGLGDLLHAATAIVHGAVVVHFDADYEHLASVDDRLRHRWIVPRGSID